MVYKTTIPFKRRTQVNWNCASQLVSSCRLMLINTTCKKILCSSRWATSYGNFHFTGRMSTINWNENATLVCASFHMSWMGSNFTNLGQTLSQNFAVDPPVCKIKNMMGLINESGKEIPRNVSLEELFTLLLKPQIMIYWNALQTSASMPEDLG